MGTGASKSKVTPVIAAQISVQPAPNAEQINSPENSKEVNNSRAGSDKNTSENTSKRSHSRPGSQTSRRSSLSSMQAGVGFRKTIGSAKRFTAGTHSRPISSISKQNVTTSKGFAFRAGAERMISPMGLPLQRDIETVDLNASTRSKTQRFSSLVVPGASPDSEIGTVIHLRTDPNRCQEKPAVCCQLCGNQFTTLGIRVPLLLLCGHSYCSNCLEKACENYPSALQCGVCSIQTPLDQQTPDSLPTNEAILELLGSKEYITMSSEKNMERCAECEHRAASMYCADCVASYCDFCGRSAHEGSNVRKKHKPVPINLKPRPQPTCKKHPGQSCVLYCETEKQPMCVLCKFYGQHRFHKCELLSKVASKYCSSVSEKLRKLEGAEKDLDASAQLLSQSVEEIDSSARKAQERLERHFAEVRKSYLTSLEHREAVLLTLVDRQVEVKQEMLEEMRLEIAAARARVLAAKEEATKLLKLSPVTGLLSRRHMDANFDRALKQTGLAPQPAIQPDVPLSLLPDITPNLIKALNQHGAILQLPPKPWFIDIQVNGNAISVQWEVSDQGSDVTADRTLTFSLHCFADVPFKMKAKLNFKRRLLRVGKLTTPESGFEDMSQYSADSESKVNFPALPPSLLGSQNISLVMLGSEGGTQQGSVCEAFQRGPPRQKPAEKNNHEAEGSMQKQDDSTISPTSTPTTTTTTDQESVPKKPSLVLKPTSGKNIASLLPEPIRLPKPTESTTEAKLPNLLVQNAPGAARPTGNRKLLSYHASAVLNLPPLIIGKSERTRDSEAELVSVTTSGVFGDSEDTQGAPSPTSPKMSTVKEDEDPDVHDLKKNDISSSDSDVSIEHNVNEFTNVRRFCKGYAFEEIYCGEKLNFHYSGLVPGATYYFRVRCHNAAGWGPWSDTIKCMTTLAISRT